MSTFSVRKRLSFTLAASAASAACLLGGALVPSAGAATLASSGGSTVCNVAGLPSQTTTISQSGITHVTVYTCSDTPPLNFSQCQTIGDTIPDVVSLHAFLCIPPQLGTSPTL